MGQINAEMDLHLSDLSAWVWLREASFDGEKLSKNGEQSDLASGQMCSSSQVLGFRWETLVTLMDSH